MFDGPEQKPRRRQADSDVNLVPEKPKVKRSNPRADKLDAQLVALRVSRLGFCEGSSKRCFERISFAGFGSSAPASAILLR